MRIFDYLHYSSSSGLLTDSNFWFHYHLYKHLFKKYPDQYHFYLTIPKTPEDVSIARKYFNFDNVTLIPIDYSWSSATSRFWFDQKGLQEQQDKYDVFDILFCNTVEVMPGLLSFFLTKGYYTLPMNYCHWTPGLVSDPLKASYDGEKAALAPEAKFFISIYLSSFTGCNSFWGKKIIMDDISIFLNDETKQEIDKKLSPLYLTVDKNEFLSKQHYEEQREDKTPVIVFNNRKSEYTGATEFVKAIQKFIKLYPNVKFKILFTQVGGKEMTRKENREIPEKYILSDKELPREEYIKKLWQSDIIVGMHTGENQFSLSFLDGMVCNKIPLFRRNIFYDELFKDLPNFNYELYSFRNEDEFVAKLYDILTNIDYYKQMNDKIQKFFIENWCWEKLIDDWHKTFKLIADKLSPYDSNLFDNITPSFFNQPRSWNDVKKIAGIGNQRSQIKYLKAVIAKFNLYDNLKSSKIELTNYKPEKLKTIKSWFG
jgi:glycosyltransferase involved in cell wall biosynthesis